MKIISIAAVTAGGKTTIVNEIKKQVKNVMTLHFDDYAFEGEVDDFYGWVKNGANYNEWNLSPLINDICKIRIQFKNVKKLTLAKKYLVLFFLSLCFLLLLIFLDAEILNLLFFMFYFVFGSKSF